MYEYKSCYQAKSNPAACTCKFHGSPVYVSWQEMGEEGWRGGGKGGVEIGSRTQAEYFNTFQ